MNLKKLLAIPVLILGLLIVFHLSRSIVTMYGRGGRVSGLAAEITNLEKEKEELERERAFRQTDAFVEREARDKLRMTREGEHILVLPEEQNEKNPNPKSQISNNKEKKSWEKWVDYWLGL